jgi:hypothetical protein
MIQVDEAAAASLNHGFILARRGAIKVKGLGAMTTYWLLAQL